MMATSSIKNILKKKHTKKQPNNKPSIHVVYHIRRKLGDIKGTSCPFTNRWMAYPYH